MRSQTSVVIWWSSWMTVPVCLTVFTTAMCTPVMLWMATGSSMSTPTTEADSTSWERASTGGTGTGVPPVPSWVPLGESLNFSHQTKCCCNYIRLLFIKDVEFLTFFACVFNNMQKTEFRDIWTCDCLKKRGLLPTSELSHFQILCLLSHLCIFYKP